MRRTSVYVCVIGQGWGRGPELCLNIENNPVCVTILHSFQTQIFGTLQ